LKARAKRCGRRERSELCYRASGFQKSEWETGSELVECEGKARAGDDDKVDGDYGMRLWRRKGEGVTEADGKGDKKRSGAGARRWGGVLARVLAWALSQRSLLFAGRWPCWLAVGLVAARSWLLAGLAAVPVLPVAAAAEACAVFLASNRPGAGFLANYPAALNLAPSTTGRPPLAC